ncbi:hypothetical protein GCM10010495_58210 [Kitasatospora herbaricolor]|uniref:aquaporin n=1 Tax=Kitasatospora herbaricolor TaxID=68217 RepID=UPI001749AAD5|nr:aquaporin [Kitasatospora herbaricolor]MDQ0306577.1 glycerol uptake facilitator-like aquaporin [Kitasatospora herbaricolor]GGV33708.1 hypothetical protein GCM10010495_58210 [Kitasatospora herbaricolor]
MTENSLSRKLSAELLGPVTPARVGVGAVPATPLLGADAPFATARPGMTAPASAPALVALGYAIGPVAGGRTDPAVTLALAATGRTPVREVPGYLPAAGHRPAAGVPAAARAAADVEGVRS